MYVLRRCDRIVSFLFTHSYPIISHNLETHGRMCVSLVECLQTCLFGRVNRV